MLEGGCSHGGYKIASRGEREDGGRQRTFLSLAMLPQPLSGQYQAVKETTGRGTEVFVHRNGHWIHTGWHLDTVAD